MRRRRGPEPEAMQQDAFLGDLGASWDTQWARINATAAILDDEGRRLALAAPNAIEWVCGEQWCNSPSTYEYWGQYQAIRDFFELRCPVCNDPDDVDVWGKSRMQLESEILLVWDNDYQEDVCPRCGSTRSEYLEDGLFHGYNTMHLVVGQRAGKSVMAGLIGTYIEHRIITLALSSPGGFGGYLNLKLKDPFEMTFLAATAVQSSDTIWAKFTSTRAESPWFQRLVPWIKRQEAEQVVPEGMKRWIYKETDNRIINQHPSVRLIINSMNSNAPGLRGRTRIAAFADEISYMEQTDSKKSATEIYRALERSQRTVRSRVKLFGGLPWLGTMVSVTSPVSRSDKGMELLKDARKVKTMFARQVPTWEFNPFEPREGMQDEFDKDPIGALRDYGAQPPGAEHPLIHDEKRWRKLTVDSALKPRARFRIGQTVGKTGQTYMTVRMEACEFMRDRTPRYIVWDAGLNWDAFAGACAHPEFGEAVGPDGRPRLITVFDWIVRILPRPGTEVLFDGVRDIMDLARRNMHIARCEFDRWQSIQLIQQIREMGIFSERVPTKDEDYIKFRVDCFEGLVRMLPPLAGEFDPTSETFVWMKDPPELSPESAAIYELLGAQQDPDTNKIVFPEKGERRGWGSNDVAQCIVHAHKIVQTQGFTERHDDRSARAARMRAEASSLGWETRGYLAQVPHGMRGGVRNWSSNRRGW